MENTRVEELYKAGAITVQGLYNAVQKNLIDKDTFTSLVKDTGDLASIKEAKISELSFTCQDTIYKGMDVELSEGNEYFEYKSLDQTNIKGLFDSVTSLGVTEFPYQSDDGKCRVYSAADIVKLYTTLEGLRISQLTYYHQMKDYVDSLTTADEVLAIEYGQSLTGTYLEHYNEMVAVATQQLQQAISRIEGSASVQA